ncbi:MAG TPA: class I tRNA ligase family protein, partial [Candidatus Polarisedimenticolia bacterium]|nr:class I tRNA ligase family protein [Candidatus Polarisedimenticolia bacterium]
VRDEKGRKMSKTRGNTIDPLELMDRHGADALRFTLAAMSSPGTDVALDLKRVEGYQAFGTKIWNAARFVLMNLSDEPPSEGVQFRADSENLKLTDRWIVSRVNEVTREVDRALGEFRYDEAASALYHFFWHELCDWYIEVAKPSLVGEARNAAESSRTRAVLLRVLDRALRLLHPFMPFLTEEIWQLLPHEGASLVTAAFPRWREEEFDADAEREMAFLMSVVTKLRNLRSENSLDPKKKLEVLFRSDLVRPRRLLESHGDIVRNLARLERFEFVQEIPLDLPAARGVITGLEMAILRSGLVDRGEERRRLSRELEKVEKELAGVEAKLENDAFARRAPAEIVEKVRAAQRELAEKKERLVRTLSTLPETELSSPPG